MGGRRNKRRTRLFIIREWGNFCPDLPSSSFYCTKEMRSTPLRALLCVVLCITVQFLFSPTTSYSYFKRRHIPFQCMFFSRPHSIAKPSPKRGERDLIRRSSCHSRRRRRRRRRGKFQEEKKNVIHLTPPTHLNTAQCNLIWR